MISMDDSFQYGVIILLSHFSVLRVRSISQSFLWKIYGFLDIAAIQFDFLLPHCNHTSWLDVCINLAIFISLIHSARNLFTSSLSSITFLECIFTLYGTWPSKLTTLCGVILYFFPNANSVIVSLSSSSSSLLVSTNFSNAIAFSFIIVL